jgi:FkbM family methyltransferase
MDDTKGQHGRSNRRNDALKMAVEAGVDWVFFLDADDRITPNAFETFGRIIAEEPELDAVWGMTCNTREGVDMDLREDQPIRLDTREEMLAYHPFLTLNIGHFVRTACAARFGFDPDMDAGEDFKFYFLLWRHYRCAKRPEIFFLHRQGEHSKGSRGATGLDWSVSVTNQWREELRDSRVYVDLRDEAGETEARMRLTNPTDIIQNEHANGRFFEASSLEKLRRLLKSDNPSIVEVGANIGNHVVWYGKHLNPARIYPVEPNPEALAILEDNIQVNGIEGFIDRRGMGYGAGRGNGRFRTQTDSSDNLGATFLVQDEEGGIETRSLDELMGDAPVDFIKIDAEGMEFDVLEGAAGVIARNRPVIWVEVKRENMLGFAQKWCKQAGYRIVDSTPYINTIDYFAVPKE